jgi:hypothetical protein
VKCASCGYENREGAKFCGECAAPLAEALTCRSCGTANPKGRKFCDSCAQPLVEPLAPDPLSYTPKHLAEKILTTRSALEGERKQVTVLFADVQGSMDLAAQVDPEEWHKIMDRFFQLLAEGVHRFEGTINQYTGDGIMALFGAPIAHEDHAQRACYAALHLEDELRRYADDMRLQHGLNFSVRMGPTSTTTGHSLSFREILPRDRVRQRSNGISAGSFSSESRVRAESATQPTFGLPCSRHPLAPRIRMLSF